MRKTFTPSQNAHVALSALKGSLSISQIASENEVHPTQIKQWETVAKDGLSTLFTDKRRNEHKDLQEKIDQLYKIIGQRDLSTTTKNGHNNRLITRHLSHYLF
ncbi:MAG: hypothetical protein COX81_01360 [Candidatus Magasanikbacteria bacterium CG_4_10_14_0_2_um_filter_37_12]|uniref:Transposase n=1 Tax=Candidatus Magasanikbacteria bacterium CG_4_10_14_0_2_um_filter_37_12 TaxID=1974637 RepID=A0A2M7V8V8_9BACT|nr:MAG: hypothetical protein COX81_01360 [Candidatus Magasanikbacteria bacterium CG_4_10_14_0_2_um_filter_37_12]